MSKLHTWRLLDPASVPPPEMKRSEGMTFFAGDGSKIIDGSSTPMISTVGWGRQEIAAALQEQAARLPFAYHIYYHAEEVERCAAKICEITQGQMDKVFFETNGSDACENAVRIARMYHCAKGNPHRFKVIARFHGWHGNSLGGLQLSGDPRRRSLNAPYTSCFPTTRIPPPYCYRCWYKQEPTSCALQCADALEDAILLEGPDEVAAFIAEPIPGYALGLPVPPKEYFRRVREICDRYDVLLVLDEVLTGMGRCGRWFCCQHFDVLPDVLAIGKGLGSGYFPVAATACTERVADPIKDSPGAFTLGHTWSNKQSPRRARRA